MDEPEKSPVPSEAGSPGPSSSPPSEQGAPASSGISGKPGISDTPGLPGAPGISDGDGAGPEAGAGPREDAVPAGPTGIAALAAVFFSPGALFEELRVRPAYVLALVTGIALSVAAAAMVPARLTLDVIRESGAEIPVGEGMVSVMKWFGVGMSIPGYLIGVLVVAGLLTLGFRFIFGDDATFPQYLAVAAHAMLITAVGALLVTPLRVMQGDAGLTLSLGTFLPFLEEGYLARLLNGVSLLSLWSWVVMGLGVSILGAERSWRGATTAIVLVGIGIIALFALIPS